MIGHRGAPRRTARCFTRRIEQVKSLDPGGSPTTINTSPTWRITSTTPSWRSFGTGSAGYRRHHHYQVWHEEEARNTLRATLRCQWIASVTNCRRRGRPTNTSSVARRTARRTRVSIAVPWAGGRPGKRGWELLRRRGAGDRAARSAGEGPSMAAIVGGSPVASPTPKVAILREL